MAGTGVRLFLSGDIAYAADVNTFLMDQVVARFATTAARDAAFGDGIPLSLGGSGKPALSEGRICYIDSLNQIQYYDGSQWQAADQFNPADDSITTAKIVDDAITTAKIANLAVTTAKLAAGSVTADKTASTIVKTTETQTLTNKTIALSSNTVSGTTAQFNSALTDNDFATQTGTETLTNKTISLGSNSISGTTAQFNSSLSDGDFATIAGAETLTNKTLTSPTLNTPTFSGVSPTITLNGDVTGSATLTNLASATITTTIAADSVALGTDTTGNYVATVTGTANQVTVSGSGTETAAITLSLPQDINTTSNPSFAGVTADVIRLGITTANEIDTTSGNLVIDSTGGTVTVDDNLVVSGNLTVSGTTTTVNTATLNIADNVVTLNSDFTTGTPTENSGIEVLRGSSSTVALRWNETSDIWDLTTDGTTYNQISTLGGTETLTNKTLTSPVITGADIRPTINSQSGTTYTIQSTDLGKYVEMTSASSNTVTLPTGIGSDGSQIIIVQNGTGKTRIVGSGVTILCTPGDYLRARYSSATLLRKSSTVWYMFGDLSAT